MFDQSCSRLKISLCSKRPVYAELRIHAEFMHEDKSVTLSKRTLSMKRKETVLEEKESRKRQVSEMKKATKRITS